MADDFETPILTVDVVLLTLHVDTLSVALQRRDKAPFEGKLALIGGYVHANKDASARATAERVLREKAGLDRIFMEQLMTFSGQKRDPRGWSASIVYYALVPALVLQGATLGNLAITPVAQVGKLPFDHAAIVETAVRRLRTKGAYSSLPAYLLGETFTLSELRRVYELVMGTALNDSAFRRKMDELRVLEPVPGGTSKATARPAQLYRLREAALKEFDRKV